MTAQNVNQYGQATTVGTVLTTPSGAITSTTTGSDLAVGGFHVLGIDVNITAISGTSASYTLSVNRKGSDGIYYSIYNGSGQTATGKISIDIGVGANINRAFLDTIQVVETIAGTSPSVTRSLSIKGK